MKKFIRYLFFIILFLVLSFFTANYFVSKKIKGLLNDNSTFSYSAFQVNSFSGNLNLEDVEFIDIAKTIRIKEIDINVDIIHYLIHKEIKIEIIDAEGLDLVFDLSSNSKKENKSNSELDIISIEKINLKNAKITLEDGDKTVFEASHIDLKVKDISMPLIDNYKWLENKSLQAEADSLFYDLDDLHVLKSERFTFKNHSIQLSNFKIEPKFSKSDYINHIKTERDLMDLETKFLKFSQFNFQKKDSIIYITSKKIQIDSSNFNIYRDKTIADDTTIKPLYSKALRELGMKLKIDSLSVLDLNLTYQELLNKNREPGTIKFNAIQGDVVNLHNFLKNENPDIKAKLKAKFTEQSDIYFNLSFVPDHERFYLSTLIKKVEDKSINSFFAPAMRMKLDGQIDEIRTSFNGNNSELNGDFKMAYKQLKLNILKKDDSKNNFASLISNIFVKHKDVEESFKLENVKRNKTKSFWNYVWIFHFEGLKKSLL
ncbi:hypothetical protein [Psychroflexus sp. MBR-150]|jgi:hypothetical protein